jgi:hypothetical protein
LNVAAYLVQRALCTSKGRGQKMKKREMHESPNGLTWDNILAILREDGGQGYTNGELAELLNADYQRVSSLTRVMFESGALSRVHSGRMTGVTYYFLPV